MEHVTEAPLRRLLCLHTQLCPTIARSPCAARISNGGVPIIDLSAVTSLTTPCSDRSRAKAAAAAAIGAACTTAGVFIIVGHGVDPHLIARAEKASRTFFDMSLEDKLRLRSPSPHISRGYVPLAAEAAAASNAGATDEAGDLNEAFAIGPVDRSPSVDPGYYTTEDAADHFHANIWPPVHMGLDLEPAMVAYYRAMEGLSRMLLQLCALALFEGLSDDFFDSKIDHQVSGLRLRNYPAPDPYGPPPPPGQLRVGPHSDFGGVTILKPEADVSGGLQVYDIDNSAGSEPGKWTDVPFVSDGYVVNLGKVMARWTNDRWRATVHRVVNPPQRAQVTTAPAGAKSDLDATRRLSLIFFLNPNYDAVIECLPTCTTPGQPPKYPPISAGKLLENLLKTTMIE